MDDDTQRAAPAAEEAPAMEGASVGRYLIERRLGRGGMGVVYAALDTQLGRKVALKFISPSLVGDQAVLSRFLREARAASSLDHPNVIAVYEVGEHQGLPFIAMALHEGESLKQRLERGPLPPDECARLLLQIAEALAAAHQRGIVHRDVKPGNVMLAPDGQVKLVDFGLARVQSDSSVTRAGELLGTLAYMAPEQHRGQEAGPAADVWAAGVVGWEMLAGRPPFGQSSPAGLVSSVLNDDPPPLGRGDLPTILLACLRKEPERRYRSAQELAGDLRHFVAGEPISVRRSTLGERLRRRASRNRAALWTALAGLVALVAIGGWLLESGARRARRAGELGQTVQQIRSMMRAAHLLPLHDTGLEREKVRALMKEVEAKRRDAEGPAEYALGVGWFSLGDEAEAKKHLQAAWAAGERAPELAYALGLVLGTEYQRAVMEAPPLDDTGQRQRELDLKQRLHDPALAYLRQAGGAADTSPAYVEALIALYDHHWDEAQKKAKSSFAEVPSLYEAGLLEADVYTMQADDALRAARRDEANALWQRANETYAKVAESGRSDDTVYKVWGDWRLGEAFERGRHGEDPTAIFEHVIALCDKGRRALSEAWWPDAMEGYAWGMWAGSDYRQKRDPRPHLQKAIAAAERSVKLRPERYQGWAALASAWSTWADNWDFPHGEDPRPALDKAVAAYMAALKLASHNELWSNLATAYEARARWEMEHGEDHLPMVRAALEAYQSAARLDAQMMQPSNALIDACGLAGEAALAELEAGRDPAPFLERAQHDCEAAIARDPAAPQPLANLAYAYWVRARHARDPLPDVEKAIERGEKAAAIQGAGGFVHAYAARALILRAEIAAARKEDPRPWLERARAQAQKAVDLDGQADGWVQLARVELLASRFAAAAGAAEKALAVKPEDLRALLISAQIQTALRRPAEARAFAERAHRVNPRYGQR